MNTYDVTVRFKMSGQGADTGSRVHTVEANDIEGAIKLAKEIETQPVFRASACKR